MSFAATALRISAGVIIWALHFAAIYGASGLFCARGFPELVAPTIAAFTAIAVVAALAVIAAGWRRRAEFEPWLSASVAGFGLVAILYEGLAVLLVPICG
jgi:hypothetical protein